MCFLFIWKSTFGGFNGPLFCPQAPRVSSVSQNRQWLVRIVRPEVYCVFEV